MAEWIVDIWEFAEHWQFEVVIKAETEQAARVEARKQYGKGYKICGVFRV